jgi:hypothetical protein
MPHFPIINNVCFLYLGVTSEITSILIEKKTETKNKTNKKQKQKQKQNYLSCFLDIHRDTISLFKSIRLLQYLSVVGVRVVSS